MTFVTSGSNDVNTVIKFAPFLSFGFTNNEQIKSPVLSHFCSFIIACLDIACLVFFDHKGILILSVLCRSPVLFSCIVQQ